MLQGFSDKYTNYSDSVLLQAVIQKEIGAFEVLYSRHAPRLYHLLLRIVHDESMAEELVQDTFCQAWQKAGQYSGTGAVTSWLCQIARNKALDQLRRQKAHSPMLAENFELFESSPVYRHPSLESEFEQAWTQQQVRQALSQIPNEQRLCLELVYFEGLTHQEIAEKMDTPLGTIKTRIRIGMDKVERWLLGNGYASNGWSPMPSLTHS